MRFPKGFLGIVLVGLLLAACGQEERPDADRTGLQAPTAALATPTLLPGLPTSTPLPGDSAADGANDPQSAAGTSQSGSTLASNPPAAAPPTATPQPTATPWPSERLELGQRFLENEDFAAAAEQYQAGLQSNALSEIQRQAALLGLGEAKLAVGEHAAAADAFGVLLADAAAAVEPSDEGPGGQGSSQVAKAYYLQGQSYQAQGECAAAIGAYEASLRADDTLAAYVLSQIADCYVAVGDQQQAIAALESAVEADAFPSVNVALRYRLAQLYQEADDFESAVAQYEAVLARAEANNTLGEATYLAGTADLLAGNPEAAYARYLEGVAQYPEAYESYLGLVALIEAGYEVDALQRGIVDYHANAFEAAVAALSSYLESTEPHDEEAHLYLAWSLEGLGNVPGALQQIDVYIDAHMPTASSVLTPTAESRQAAPTADSLQATPTVESEPRSPSIESAAKGTLEKGKMLARAGRLEEAAETYASYVTTYGDQKDGPFAAWWSAALSERLGDPERAIEGYQLLAELYPEHEDADEALFRAGKVAYEIDNLELAQSIWASAAERYPGDNFGAAATVWLLRTAPPEMEEEWLALAGDVHGSTYYPLRVQHILSDTAPFEAPESLILDLTERDLMAAERWLQAQLDLPDEGDLAVLSEELASDGRLLRGQALWQLGLKEQAKTELESLRSEYASDPLASFQLAIFFRELGLYRSSILAAVSVMRELGVDVFDAPRYIAGLAYPTYYSDLILAEADNYGFDPLLQFSLVRQESLFESFARSGAAAQGLSQVIPDTGAYIAQRLAWPDYVNEDLYRPYVGIAFGAYYLDQQLRAFDGDVAAALSAYNGGPGNAARWYEEAGGDIDLYVDTVDFYETQQYIERIYAGQAIYRLLYGNDAE